MGELAWLVKAQARRSDLEVEGNAVYTCLLMTALRSHTEVFILMILNRTTAKPQYVQVRNVRTGTRHRCR